MAKYLLPCECGEGVPVEVSQAGQSVTCQCGKPLEVPSLRGIRDLDPVEDADESDRRTADWTPMRGAVFVISVVSLLAGLGIAVLGYRAMTRVQDVSIEQEQELYATQIDQFSAEQLLDTWQLIHENGLGPKDNNPYVEARRYRARMKAVSFLGVGLCVTGLLGIIGSMLGRGKSAA